MGRHVNMRMHDVMHATTIIFAMTFLVCIHAVIKNVPCKLAVAPSWQRVAGVVWRWADWSRERERERVVGW